jgi:hypothetical protein
MLIDLAGIAPRRLNLQPPHATYHGAYGCCNGVGTVNVTSETKNISKLQSVTGCELTMVTADDCRAQVAECLRLRNTGKISERRITALMAMMTSWIALANQVERYQIILRDEESRVEQ